jgi:hypothetical protein
MIAAMFRAIWSHVHLILIQMMTDRTTQTCPFRVWGVFGFLSLVGFMGWSIHSGHPFNPMEYGGAMATYLAAWGAAIFAKGKVE